MKTGILNAMTTIALLGVTIFTSCKDQQLLPTRDAYSRNNEVSINIIIDNDDRGGILGAGNPCTNMWRFNPEYRSHIGGEELRPMSIQEVDALKKLRTVIVEYQYLRDSTDYANGWLLKND